MTFLSLITDLFNSILGFFAGILTLVADFLNGLIIST